MQFKDGPGIVAGEYLLFAEKAFVWTCLAHHGFISMASGCAFRTGSLRLD